MTVWFDGSDEIECTLGHVRAELEEGAAHHVAVVSKMPGMTDVVLIDEGPDGLTIETNEGVMKRTNISTRSEDSRIVTEFDEQYTTTKPALTVTSHHVHEFTPSKRGVHHHTIVQDVSASGLIGAIYRRFGKATMGKALLSSYRRQLELPPH